MIGCGHVMIVMQSYTAQGTSHACVPGSQSHTTQDRMDVCTQRIGWKYAHRKGEERRKVQQSGKIRS